MFEKCEHLLVVVAFVRHKLEAVVSVLGAAEVNEGKCI